MTNQLREYAYYETTRGMCKTCRDLVNARIFEKENRIYQENLCPKCGNTATIISQDKNWYFKWVDFPIRLTQPTTVHTHTKFGCPYDCGICPWHENSPSLPVFSITNACNLNCPICFTYNRKDKRYDMTEEEMKETVRFLLQNKDKYDLINITGGEPTLHPRLLKLLEIAKTDRIGRITMNSNGIELARDEALIKGLKDLDVYVILSFNTFDGNSSRIIHGKDIVDVKLKALENLSKYNIGVTLLNVMIKGINDHEIFDIIGLSQKYANIRSITIQNMTFTGQGGTRFQPRERLTLDMAAETIEAQSMGMIKRDHFFPLPSNHPLCYSIAYFFKDDTRLYSFTDILSVEELVDIIGPHYLIHPDDRFHDTLQDAMARSWANHENKELLLLIKKLLKSMYPTDKTLTPFERQRIAEASILTVYIHAHMDEENFDMSRIVCCTDLVPVDGKRLIPACAYNLFYRMKDERFWKEHEDG